MTDSAAIAVAPMVTTYWLAVPSAPAKMALLLPSSIAVWLQITFVMPLFQFDAAKSQAPDPAVMVAPSPGVVSQKR